MGRARKQTAEYFPHFTTGGRTLFILEKRWGNDGYAFWYKLMEILAASDGHTYSCDKACDMEYVASNAGISTETATEILDMLGDLGDIDSELWQQRKIIWCQGLVDSLAGLYSKRTAELPKKPSITGADADTAAPTEPQTETEPQPKPKRETRGRKKIQKKHYAEFVTLAEAEYEKLVEDYGEEKTTRCIEALDNYKGSSGRVYKSDYRAILNWVIKKIEKEEQDGSAKRFGNDADRRDNGAGEFKPSGGFKNDGGDWID